METVKLSIGTVNITQWLLINMRYTDDPNVIADSQSFAPGTYSPIKNLTFNNVIAKPVFIDVRESPDGIALGTLLSTFQANVTTKQTAFRRFFYTVGGDQEDGEGVVVDPVPGSRELTDSRFEGKTIDTVFRESFRDLKEWEDGQPFEANEWKRVDNTIQLLNSENGLMDGPIFNEGETYVVTLVFLQDVPVNDTSELPVVFEDITETMTLTSDNRRKTNVIDGITTRLVMTAEPLASLLDGEWYKFLNNSGNQYQAVFKCAGSDSIRYNRATVTSLVIGIGEQLEVAVKTTNGTKYFEVIYRDAKRLMVGQFFKSYNNTEPSAMLCDGGPVNGYDGDDYPDIWRYILNLPANFAVVSLTVVEGKEACWRYFSAGSVKKFWPPDKQNGFDRNLRSFSNVGTDVRRRMKITGGYLTWDYPGGKQFEMSAPHRHYNTVPSEYNGSSFPTEEAGNLLNKIRAWLRNWAKPGDGKESYFAVGSEAEPSAGRTSQGHVQEGTTEASCVDNYEGRPTNSAGFEFVRI